jgi:hypothetical protein
MSKADQEMQKIGLDSLLESIQADDKFPAGIKSEIIELIAVARNSKERLNEMLTRALLFAIKFGSPQITSALLAAGANASDQQVKKMLYQKIFSLQDNAEIIKALLLNGFDANSKNDSG